MQKDESRLGENPDPPDADVKFDYDIQEGVDGREAVRQNGDGTSTREFLDSNGNPVGGETINTGVGHTKKEGEDPEPQD